MRPSTWPALWLALVPLGCQPATPQPAPSAKPLPSQAVPSQTAPSQTTPQGPPTSAPYQAPQAWRPRQGDAEPVAPPAAATAPWRLRVTQHAPMQRKTPKWQPLAANASVTAAMQASSRFRCQVTPLAVQAVADDFGRELEGWTLRRELRCSGDGWQTWTAYPHVVQLTPDGKPSGPQVTQARLRERTKDANAPVLTVVELRHDPERLAATKGPPKILSATEAAR